MTDLDALTRAIRDKVGPQPGLGRVAVLDFGAFGVIRIDGASSPAVVDNETGAADVTISMSPEDFIGLRQGRLDPMMAFMQGKMKIEGDMALAQKLAPMLRA